MYTIKVLLYESLTDKLRLGGEAVVLLGAVYYLLAELRQVSVRPFPHQPPPALSPVA
jgi:hypothetical protein